MMALDTIVHLETPEGIDLDLSVAGVVPRALAWLLDLLIRIGVYLLLAMVFGALGNIGAGVLLIAAFVLEWGYPFVFEAWRGQTPGKKAMGLVVVNEDGTPLTWSGSLLRNLLRVADFLPFAYGIGLLWCLFHPRNQRLGDLAARTLVVYADTDPVPRAEVSVPPAPLPVVLAPSEQLAILDFAERANQLSPQRQEELADLLTPLHGLRGTAALARLQGYARRLTGGA